MTIFLTKPAYGDILPPMIITTWPHIEDLTIPDNLSIATQEKAWLNERYISHGMKKIWLK